MTCMDPGLLGVFTPAKNARLPPSRCSYWMHTLASYLVLMVLSKISYIELSVHDANTENFGGWLSLSLSFSGRCLNETVAKKLALFYL